MSAAARRREDEDTRLRVTICAWCGRHAIGGRWDDDEVVAHGPEPATSSSVCPRCFAALAPGVQYPEQS